MSSSEDPAPPEPAPGNAPAATPSDASAVTPRRRRPRYRGTHPRRFEEKYKELDPERFPEEAAKAAERGGTAAGSHRPILVDEVLAALRPLAGAVVLDCTLGWGGHTEAIAAEALPGGRILALDRDGEELARTSARLARKGIAVEAVRSNFAGAAGVLRERGIAGVDAVLADLGVSSMQLDRPDRGMSFRADGPLDMRMDRTRGETAADRIARSSEADLEALLRERADEPDAAAIARTVRAAVDAGTPPRTTYELAALVLRAKGLPPGRWRKKDAFSAHPATRTFQALRIAVNREDEALAQLLRDLPWLLLPGGRACLLTFHSGEERRVAAAFAAQAAAGLWGTVCEAPLRPGREETRANPRARSARLWRAVRAG